MRLSAGDDWTEDQHAAEVMAVAGKVLADRLIGSLHEAARGPDHPDPLRGCGFGGVVWGPAALHEHEDCAAGGSPGGRHGCRSR
jgi:hypothetical protein